MDVQFIRERITELRMQQNVSEYQMSLDVGMSKSYIQGIVNGGAPSVEMLLKICAYLNVTPTEFFDSENQDTYVIQEALSILKQLDKDEIEMLFPLMKKLAEYHK